MYELANCGREHADSTSSGCEGFDQLNLYILILTKKIIYRTKVVTPICKPMRGLEGPSKTSIKEARESKLLKVPRDDKETRELVGGSSMTRLNLVSLRRWASIWFDDPSTTSIREAREPKLLEIPRKPKSLLVDPTWIGSTCSHYKHGPQYDLCHFIFL